MCNCCCAQNSVDRRALACALREAEAAAQRACEVAKVAARAENRAEELACAAREAAKAAEHATRTAENAASCAEEALAKVRELINDAAGNTCCGCACPYVNASVCGTQNASCYASSNDCNPYDSGRSCCN
ncbi:MAG: hypothetical protein E7414_06025 [Ruminococcaceae bacterium]|nr:hypothetical protein [Oscillospiraceae bacterium]